MATGSRGGASRKPSVYAQVPVPPQPKVESARKSYDRVTVTPGQRVSSLRGSHPPMVHVTPHQPQPTEADLIYQNAVQAIGPDVIRKASNPRVAALQSVLGAATGIPAAVHAVRTHNVPAAVADTAALLPFGRAADALRGGLAATKVIRGVEVVPRTAAEAEAHLAQAAKNAMAEGHLPGGGGVKSAPRVKVGETTPETGGDRGAQVRSALKGTKEGVPGAKEMHAAQAEEQSAARAERAATSEAALRKAGGGLVGHYASRAAQRGELPKIHWNNQLVDLDQNTLDQMVRFVQGHPALRKFERDKTVDVIVKMTEGGIPAPHEQRLLERAFGKETAGQMRDLANAGDWKRLAVDVLNVPRALMASGDFSAFFRQAMVAGMTHPSLWRDNFVPMLKMAKNEGFFQDVQSLIHEDPLYPLMHKAGIAFTDIGASAKQGARDLGMREEARMSNLAEQIPVIGRYVRGSDRAYVGLLNKIRYDYAKRLITDAAAAGRDLNDEKLLHDIGRFVNMATGRGNVPGALQDHLATMNALFFSPRLMASRIDFLLSPITYAKADPFVRREAWRSLASVGSTALTILSLARLAGAKVSGDPTSSDFGKIKIGNTRIDILGGHQQYIRLAAQLYTGRITSSSTGKTINLGSGFGKTSRWDVFVRFLQSKASPLPAMFVDALRGEDFAHKPVHWNDLSSWEREALGHLVPFIAQDLASLYEASGPAGLLASPLDVFGVGVQAYKPQTPKSRYKVNGYGGSGGSGGSVYGGSSGSGGSVYAGK